MKTQYRIVRITEPQHHPYYIVQRSYWLFGTRWRTFLKDSDHELPLPFLAVDEAKQALERKLEPTKREVVEVI